MKSRNITYQRKGGATFAASEDYLSLRDHEYVQDHYAAVDFRTSSSVRGVVHFLEKETAKTPEQERIDEVKRKLRYSNGAEESESQLKRKRKSKGTVLYGKNLGSGDMSEETCCELCVIF